MEVNDVLAHYGIPGMKWGHRKGTQLKDWGKEAKKITVSSYTHPIITKQANKQSIKESGKLTTKIRRKALYQNTADLKDVNRRIEDTLHEKNRPSVLSDDHVKKTTIQKKRLEEMSNTELRQLNERLQLERTYKSLTPTELAPGKKFVNDVVKESGKEVAKQYTKKYMVSAVEALLL